jgi:hypothetical protein
MLPSTSPFFLAKHLSLISDAEGLLQLLQEPAKPTVSASSSSGAGPEASGKSQRILWRSTLPTERGAGNDRRSVAAAFLSLDEGVDLASVNVVHVALPLDGKLAM